MANFSIDGGQLGTCALIDPNWDLTEEFGVVVGHTLVDATTPSASVLIINPNAEEVVWFTYWRLGACVGCVSGPVGSTTANKDDDGTSTDYLEDIVRGSHASLGDTGRQSLRELPNRYEHVFPGEPVTGNRPLEIGPT